MREKIFAATITALAASATLAGKTLHTYGDSPPLQSIAEPETMEVTLFDEHPEWGYMVEGLGAGHDEMALVFTNQNASSMAWTVPADLTDVQFLVVGGGGGGGADYNPNSGSAPFLGGGGGGGGGVVTGVVSTVVSNTEFSIKVGAGGAGGQCNKTQVDGGYGASYAGSDSTVSLGGVAVLTAFGGGNDKGASNPSDKQGRVGGTGGSNAGSRGGHGGAQEDSPTRGSVAASFASQLAGYGALGNFGGAGYAGWESYWGYYSASGGGGGATTAGGTPTDYTTGGNGGEGLASDITGTLRVYGSGGGGGTISGYLGGTGGTGAGSGNTSTGDNGNGQDALPNQGGGGGGGGRYGNGGAGGSGIVVLRFRVPTAATSYNDPQGNEIQDPGVVSWLSANGFTQDDIDDLGNDAAATERLYECYLLGCDFRVQGTGGALSLTGIAVSNGVVSLPVQFVRKAPLGAINGMLYFYGANDLAAGFSRSPIAEEAVSFGENDDPSFGIAPNTVPASGVVTQTVTAAIDSAVVTNTFFKAVIAEGDAESDLGGVQLWENGPYWAECNVGASAPEESGYYFWWGDTVGYVRSGGTKNLFGLYTSVTWASSTGEQMSGSPFSLSSCPTYGKDNSTLQSEGWIDATGNLVAAHDAATAHLGAPWRMPTDAEFFALTNNCTATWITTNGVSGRLVTGKGAYADRSLFLPAPGYGSDTTFGNPNLRGYYWSSTPDSDNSYKAWYLYFNSSLFQRDTYYGRQYGLSVRPVRDAD